MLCILYVNAFGFLLGTTGLLIERVLPATHPRRWMWCAIILSSIAIPGTYRFHHALDVTDVTGAQTSGWWTQVASYDALIGRVWLWISAILLVWGIANIYRVSRILYGSSRKTAIVDGVPVVVTESIGPATVGIVDSSVLLPKWVLALPAVQRKYVVRHEDEHRRAHDADILLVASLSLLLMPWNLAMWWQLRRLSLAVEMDCDNRVVAALGNPNRYGELLLTIAEVGSRGPRLQPAFLGGAGSLEQRLRALVAREPLRKAQKILFPALVAVLLFIVLSVPHPVHEHGSHTHGAMTTQR
jgi:beta-lactamase regulating signal transducer with metallopeptidase domain